MTERVEGNAWKYGDHVSSDEIFPGRYTYTLTDHNEIREHALEGLDPSFAGGVQAGDVVVGGLNWGCGSSREQAVTCLKYAGVGAIVAVSFARIFYRNAISAGLPAIHCVEAVEAIGHGERISIDLDESVIHCSGGTFAFPPFPETVRSMLRSGGLIPHLQRALGEE